MRERRETERLREEKWWIKIVTGVLFHSADGRGCERADVECLIGIHENAGHDRTVWRGWALLRYIENHRVLVPRVLLNWARLIPI